MPSSLFAAAHNTKVTVRGAHSSSLYIKDEKSTMVADGTLPSSVSVGGKTTKLFARGEQTSDMVNAVGRLSSSLHKPARGTKKNATCFNFRP